MDNQITEPYENDINFMSTIDIYTYNERGDMIQDNMEKIYVDWLVNGKIKGVRRFATVADLPDLEFKYDAMGNRISKLVKTRTGTDIDYENEWQKTYYVRDAQGNVLATYDRTWQGRHPAGYDGSDELKITEQHLYGSSRVGVNRANKITASRNYTVGAYGANGITVQYNYASSIDYTAPNPVRTRYETGRRNYELTNHLGNVLAVVTDNVLARIENPPAPGVLRFVPHIVQANDYYPFGSIMPGRSVNSGGYRYGYQGSEKTDEISGSGNHFTTFYREGDTRLLRWWSNDPKAAQQPWLSSYSYMNGNPIWYNDPYGDIIKYDKNLSPEDRKALRREVRQLRRGSYTARKIYRDLDRSDNVHTLTITTEGSEVIPQGPVSQDGNSTLIKINLTQEPEAGGPSFLNVGHEFGHAWRFDRGLPEADLPKPDFVTADLTAYFKQTRILSDRRRITEEKEASHIENIIRAELDPTGMKIKLRLVYSNIIQYQRGDGVLDLHQIPKTDVIKPDFQYYNKDKKANYQSIIKQ